MPATAYLLPVGSVVSGATVSTRGKNYTADDESMQQLLHDAGLDTIADLFPSVGKLRYDGDDAAPRRRDRLYEEFIGVLSGTPVTGVEVTCVIGVSTPTPLTLHYDVASFTPGCAAPAPVVGMGDGDGTVNRYRVCR